MADTVEQVAEGVHLVSAHHVNCYLLGNAQMGFTLVDTGLPASWDLLGRALARLGRSMADLRAVVLTHAHFDHIGTAARIRRELGIPVYLHPDDHWLAAHPYRYRHERARPRYLLRYPKALPGLASMVRAGALRVPPVTGVEPMSDGQQLPVPGEPLVVHTPGHTDGHCVLHVAEADALLVGDALVTDDPYTSRTGPTLVAGAATASAEQARASLERLRFYPDAVLLPGHGRPWTEGVEQAVQIALARPML
ncbi:MBL fold metallo-hydrolase [Desertihabitans brevis]|nr:MBL fold metallo-hydrolase [Desertihabitans brevis]